MGTPRSYEKVRALEVYSDKPRTEKDKIKAIKEEEHDGDFEKAEEASIYCMGSYKLPCSTLFHPRLYNLNGAARSVYIWILTKRKILEMAARVGVDNEETRRLPAVTIRNIEVAKYTGIPAGYVPEKVEDLVKAGLIETEKVMAGAKLKCVLCTIKEWPASAMGFVQVPIKTMLTPAWINLTHSAKWLYLILLYEHGMKKGRAKAESEENEDDEQPVIDRFPFFELAYSEIEKHGLKSDETVNNAIKELEALGFIKVMHGPYSKRTGQREINRYKLLADHLHLWQDTVRSYKACLKNSRRRIRKLLPAAK